MKWTALVLLFYYLPFEPAKCAKILGVFPFTATSHYTLGSSLMMGLAEAGHDVTVISPFEQKKVPSKGSYRNIVLNEFAEEHAKMAETMNLFDFGGNIFTMIPFLQMMTNQVADLFFSHPKVKNLLDSNEKFDAVIVHQFGADALKIISHRFEAPLIALSPVGASSWTNRLVGNPEPLSYIPYVMSDVPIKMSFFQRLLNVIYYTWEQLVFHLYSLPNQGRTLHKYYPNSPDMNDLYYNVSLVLINSHESFGQPVPLVPNMVQIGGFHVQPPKKLPEDIQKFLDNANDGVIYFSMGSNLKSKMLPADKRDALLNAFRKLKQKVLWKWEADVLPGQPPNVKLGKWLPQQDILAHPNVKLFITHSGLLSTAETIYHGVPILAIPVFGDQHLNANAAVLNGYAKSISYRDPDFSEEKISSLLNELLNNSTYTNNVKERSRIFHDRPMKPMETAVYWVEYVIRHRGATHLRVAGAELPWYQYLLLDVFGFLTLCAVLVFKVLYLLTKNLFQKKTEDNLKKTMDKLKKN